ncbi:MAG: hypothetical protein VKM92_06655 [Cyanobacteriota bacterium]|nr:hypothetical protein [Cyanobacteriota bacterium]
MAEPASSPTPGGPDQQPRWLQLASLVLFVVLAGYVSFSGIRLAVLLWQRFAVG